MPGASTNGSVGTVPDATSKLATGQFGAWVPSTFSNEFVDSIFMQRFLKMPAPEGATAPTVVPIAPGEIVRLIARNLDTVTARSASGEIVHAQLSSSVVSNVSEDSSNSVESVESFWSRMNGTSFVLKLEDLPDSEWPPSLNDLRLMGNSVMGGDSTVHA